MQKQGHITIKNRDTVNRVAWSTDNPYIACCSSNIVCIWKKILQDYTLHQVVVILKAIKHEKLNNKLEIDTNKIIDEKEIYDTLDTNIKELIKKIKK